MESPNLIPEQRPDKNGNIVTRWVRSMFQPRETALAIPMPSIAPQRMSPGISEEPGKKEAKAIFDRLVLLTTEGDRHYENDAYVDQASDPNDDATPSDELRTIEAAFDNGEYEVFPLFDKFGGRYGYSHVRRAAEIYRSNGLVPSDLTDEHLSSYIAFRWSVKRAVLENEATKGGSDYQVYLNSMNKVVKASDQDEDDDLPEPFTDALKMADHVLIYPSDAPTLDEIVRRGITDKQRALEMLDEIKEGRLAPAISDGYL